MTPTDDGAGDDGSAEGPSSTDKQQPTVPALLEEPARLALRAARISAQEAARLGRRLGPTSGVGVNLLDNLEQWWQTSAKISMELARWSFESAERIQHVFDLTEPEDPDGISGTWENGKLWYWVPVPERLSDLHVSRVVIRAVGSAPPNLTLAKSRVNVERGFHNEGGLTQIRVSVDPLGLPKDAVFEATLELSPTSGGDPVRATLIIANYQND